MRSARPLRAWRSGFDLAVDVFRLTAGLEDSRTNGFVRRLRAEALRVPALIARAASRDSRARCREDLREAQRALEDLAAHTEWLRALIYVDPGEALVLTRRIAAVRGDLGQVQKKLELGRHASTPTSARGAVEQGKFEV